MDDAVLTAAITAIDEAHRADPAGEELAYADSIERWMGRLLETLTPLARIAARCQHLERWTLPRSEYPEGRKAYLRWRIAVHERQGERAEQLALGAGVDPDTAAELRALVAKRRPTSELGQALEDAACLVFLEEQAADFIAEKAYDDAKVIAIVQKTWAKMSPTGHELALTLPLGGRLGELVQRALA